MNTKSVVTTLSLMGCLAASAAGILGDGSDDMHWRVTPPGPGTSLSAPQHGVVNGVDGAAGVDGEQCEPHCDDMHW